MEEFHRELETRRVAIDGASPNAHDGARRMREWEQANTDLEIEKDHWKIFIFQSVAVVLVLGYIGISEAQIMLNIHIPGENTIWNFSQVRLTVYLR